MVTRSSTIQRPHTLGRHSRFPFRPLFFNSRQSQVPSLTLPFVSKPYRGRGVSFQLCSIIRTLDRPLWAFQVPFTFTGHPRSFARSWHWLASKFLPSAPSQFGSFCILLQTKHFHHGPKHTSNLTLTSAGNIPSAPQRVTRQTAQNFQCMLPCGSFPTRISIN